MKRMLFLTLLLPLSTSAANFQAGETLTVKPEGNTYAAGAVVQVTEEVQGDVYLAGETVQVLAGILEDAFLAGQTVTISGPISDDLHVFGATVILNESVGGDALLFGQKIILAPEVKIGGSTVIGGESITANGTFNRDVRLMGSSITLDGSYKGNITVDVGEALEVKDTAKITGNLTLSIPEDAAFTLPEGVVQGEVIKKFLTKEERKGAGKFLGVINVLSLLSRLLIGGLFIGLARKFAVSYGDDIRQKFWTILGTGFLALIVPPILAIFLFAPVVTFPLAVLLLIFWGTFLYVGTLFTGLIVANFFFPLRESDPLLPTLGKFAFGTLILFVLKSIPFIGFFLVFVVTLLSFGSLAQYYRQAGKTLRKEGVV